MIRCPFFPVEQQKTASQPPSLPEGLPPARRGWGWYDRSQDDQGGHTPQSLRDSSPILGEQLPPNLTFLHLTALTGGKFCVL